MDSNISFVLVLSKLFRIRRRFITYFIARRKNNVLTGSERQNKTVVDGSPKQDNSWNITWQGCEIDCRAFIRRTSLYDNPFIPFRRESFVVSSGIITALYVQKP